ncbi:MAG: penicillin-binding protein activator [Hyphomonadaceae bacterium]
MTFQRSSARGALTPSAKTAAALSLAALMAACATGPSPGPGPGTVGPAPPPPGTQVQTRDGVTPPFMEGRQIVRVGLLLPFSLRPQDAAALYSAAELALFDHGDPSTLLIPRDAGADEAQANAAARALAADGADIIIGPVLREGVLGAGVAVRNDNIPVIGFSSDRTVAGNGVYLLSFQLEDEVLRIVSYAASRNIRSMALLAPANEYGRRVEQALRAEAAARGVTVTASRLYNRTDGDARTAANEVAAALGGAQAILIAESGTPLRAIGTALSQSANARGVQLIGTSVWSADAPREPSLAGGWYVSPDPNARTNFEGRYQEIFAREPTRLASLAYDAVALATLLSRDRGAQGFSRAAIENPEGFGGSDGIFRFHSNGAIERGMAIMQVGANTATAIDPAPRRFTPAQG